MSRENLTFRQMAFVRAHVRLGGLNATQAAIAAGYSCRGGGAGAAVTASRLLSKPHIINALHREIERGLLAGCAVGVTVLESLAASAENEYVRLQAAQALLNHGATLRSGVLGRP